MYTKDLTKTVNVRITEQDYAFLEKTAAERGQKVPTLVRYIIGDYRRSLAMWEVMKTAYEAAGKGVSDGDK